MPASLRTGEWFAGCCVPAALCCARCSASARHYVDSGVVSPVPPPRAMPILMGGAGVVAAAVSGAAGAVPGGALPQAAMGGDEQGRQRALDSGQAPAEGWCCHGGVSLSTELRPRDAKATGSMFGPNGHTYNGNPMACLDRLTDSLKREPNLL